MFLKKVWKRINPFSNLLYANSLNGIYSEKEFRTILDRERSRADRNVCGFTLMLFDIKNTKTNNTSYRRLIKALTSRHLRSTDEVGWFNNESIGVLLYNTTPVGARSFANDFLVETTPLLPTLSFTIYTYPADLQNIYQKSETVHEKGYP